MCLYLISLLLVSSALAQYPSRAEARGKWILKQFESLLTFGDSYTDEMRLLSWVSNGGNPPPPGTYLNESLVTATGGRVWARYVIQYTGKTVRSQWRPKLTLYNYAVSGGVCSNDLSPRYFDAINAPFPDLDKYEVPAFIADKSFRDTTTGKPYFTPPLAKNAIFAIRDGTNDLGYYAYLTDSQKSGTTLVDYTNCIFRQMDRLYNEGARYFVLMNIVPLEKAPLYSKLGEGGVIASRFWQDKPKYFGGNVTTSEEKMKEQVALVNECMKYKLPYEVTLANRYPGANFAHFDVNKLVMAPAPLFLAILTKLAKFRDIISHPSAYLNGTRPANTTGYVAHCNLDGTDCPVSDSPDSFLWYDELHPSEQTERIVAKEFVNVISGKSKYAAYY